MAKIYTRKYCYEIETAATSPYKAIWCHEDLNTILSSFRNEKNSSKFDESGYSAILYQETYYRKEDSCVDYFNPEHITLKIYLAGNYTKPNYLKKICNRFNLSIDDFKLDTTDNKITYIYDKG